jgi:NADH-quinone oxidoreductase subunit E
VKKLGVKMGEITADGSFEVKGVECLEHVYAPRMQLEILHKE